MHIINLHSTVSIVLFALSITTLNVEAQPLSGQYPPLDTPPPPVASWTALVDQSKLPKAPVRRTVDEACPPTDEFCDWTCTTCTKPESDFTNCPKQNDWALTYDDGPTNNTLTVLNALNARNIKATFFVVGSRVYENPGILKQIVDSGHQVGVHTWSHTPLTTQTTEEIIAETKWTEKAIIEATGLQPKWFRAPQGDADDRVRGILTQLGYKLAFWNLDTNDWMSDSDSTFDLNWITNNFTIWVQNKTSPTGFASLEHDAFTLSSSKAPAAMDIVLGAKFNPQSVAVCLGDNQPYVQNVQLPASGKTGNTTAGGANGTSSAETGGTYGTTSTGTGSNGTSSAGTGGTYGTSTGTGAMTSPSSASSIEKSPLIGIASGLVMIFGFIGTAYI